MAEVNPISGGFMSILKNIFWMIVTLFIIFLILDVTNLTGFLLYPYTRFTKGSAAAGDTTS